ncbi:MAG: DUF1631 family protein [Undibacterium sp.]|uniref:DUF1631 family protein n=1 Tax=Undibacterium sp. TaxID=1914977 RepID=UPI0027200F72|nr:DUF1631 family protein [Undibacterium sp.]MDO8651442.1 DUF1631 family protein [Undibacterium sp.]
MLPISTKNPSSSHPQPPVARGDVWHALIQQASHLTVAQIDAFVARLANALLAASEHVSDAKEANLSYNAGQLLKNNAYSFYYLAAAAIAVNFRQEIELLESKGNPQAAQQDIALSLVTYEEMDTKLALGRASRTLELANAEKLAALNMRLANLIECESLSIAQNPFRPEVFLKTMQMVWCEFNPDAAAHHLILPLFRTDILFDFAPIFQALNETLVARGILPDLQESYRIKKSLSTSAAEKEAEIELKAEAQKNDVAQKLKKYFSEKAGQFTSASHRAGAQNGTEGSDQSHRDVPASAVDTKLFHYLADLQKSMAIRQMVAGTQDVMRLSQIREQMPELVSTGVEKNTLDLLSKIFDSVLLNQDIPRQIKDLISLLQVPVLKAALMDKEFFFQEAHPARRLIDLLSKYSVSVDQAQGVNDPLFQAMKENVSRVQWEFDQRVDLFDAVVSDLENFVAKEEAAKEEALQQPIKQALQKEKFTQAKFAAKNEVALRIGTGEVLAFVETFLENRWIKVLTLAYSVKEEKPQAVADAIKTMDDLIWSVKPKITLEQRQEMVSRLPAILTRLNKWLSLIKWEDADQLQFFAELAECHASIVRAPIDLSPERQLEMAVEVAQQATERRLAKRALEATGLPAVAESDDFVDVVANLERGIWLQFTKKDNTTHNVRLAWVSPMRSLYIFTSSQKEKSFSVSTVELEQSFREHRAQILVLDKVVDRALMAALEELPLPAELTSD